MLSVAVSQGLGPIHVPGFLSKKKCQDLVDDHTVNEKSMTIRHRDIVFNPRKRKSKTKYITFMEIGGVCFDVKKVVDTYMLEEHNVYRSNMQITKYETTDFFKIHSDALTKEQMPVLGPQRLWTAVVYLNDDYKGGELVFPYKHQVFFPEQGDLVCWPNVDDHNELIREMDHASMTVFDGTKYIAVFLYTERLCKSVSNEGTQLECV